MKKMTTYAALVVVVLGAGLGWAAGADKEALAKRQEALNAEYSLAKEAKFYFAFDVLGRKLELRVRGMALKTWPIQGMRFWGRPDFTGSVELVKKTTLKAPQRIIIKPGDSEVIAPVPTTKPAPGPALTPADYDLEALELRDMPNQFSLDLDNGLHITISSKTGDSPGFGARMREALRWYVSLPLKHLFGQRTGRGMSDLELVFADEKDAQAIYWHFFDGIKGIIQ